MLWDQVPSARNAASITDYAGELDKRVRDTLY
jgi:hypothetical protein